MNDMLQATVKFVEVSGNIHLSQVAQFHLGAHLAPIDLSSAVT